MMISTFLGIEIYSMKPTIEIYITPKTYGYANMTNLYSIAASTSVYVVQHMEH